MLLSSPGNVTPSHCPESDDAISEACTSGKREAALFVLRAKYVHKVAQSSLNRIICDYTSMLESTLHRLETGVMAALGSADAVLTKEISEIFHSQCESDPFYGLTTEFMQKFFKEEFHHMVGTCNCDQTYTNNIIIVIFDYWQEQLRGSLDIELLPQ